MGHSIEFVSPLLASCSPMIPALNRLSLQPPAPTAPLLCGVASSNGPALNGTWNDMRMWDDAVFETNAEFNFTPRLVDAPAVYGTATTEKQDCGTATDLCGKYTCTEAGCGHVAQDLPSFVAHLQQHLPHAGCASPSPSAGSLAPSTIGKAPSSDAAMPTSIGTPVPLFSLGEASAALDKNHNTTHWLKFTQMLPLVSSAKKSEWLSKHEFQPPVKVALVNKETGAFCRKLPAECKNAQVRLRLFDHAFKEIVFKGVMTNNTAALTKTAATPPACFTGFKINKHCSDKKIHALHYHVLAEAFKIENDAEVVFAREWLTDPISGECGKVSIKVRRLQPEWKAAGIGPFADHSKCFPCHCCLGGGKKEKTAPAPSPPARPGKFSSKGVQKKSARR